MIGDFWFNIDGYQQRGRCVPCEATEDMDHILTTCRAGHAAKVWELARKLWPYGDSQWPAISLGTILGSGCLTITRNRTTHQEPNAAQPKPGGASRLLQITISEAAHLVWVLRCERVIQEVQHSAEMVKQRWYKAINRRLTDDKITATMIKRSYPFTWLVEGTWEDALKKISNLPKGWMSNCEVLVGRHE